MKPNKQDLQEEQDILDAFETGSLKPVDDSGAIKQAHQQAATRTFKKDARLNIRLSSRTLRALQKNGIGRGYTVPDHDRWSTPQVCGRQAGSY